MRILFIGETRRTFASAASTEGNARVMGEFEAYDIRFTEAFRAPSEAEITFHASREWFSSNLLPSSKPGSKSKRMQCARYVSFTGPANNKIVMVITSVKLDETQEDYEGNFANITVTAQDPRVWLTTMPSDLTNPPAKFTGSVKNLLIELSKRCSNANFSGKLAFQKLPITALGDFTPNAQQAAAGIVPTSQLPSTAVVFELNDPTPVDGDLQTAILLAGPDYELYPLLTHGADGSDAPWWRWVVRKRQTLPETLSEEEGVIMVQGFTADTLINEVVYYDETAKTYSLGNGSNPTLPSHFGPWFGATVVAESAPAKSDPRKWGKRRARAATKSLKSIAIDLDVDSNGLSVNRLNPGTYISFNMSGKVFHLSVDEVTWSYDYQVGDWALDDWSL